jgi:hypothetical protein
MEGTFFEVALQWVDVQFLYASGFRFSRHCVNRPDRPSDGLHQKGTLGLVDHAHHPSMFFLSFGRAARVLTDARGKFRMVRAPGFVKNGAAGGVVALRLVGSVSSF